MPIIKHDLSIAPGFSSTILRRYIPEDRLLSFLQSHELYFCRVDRFSDPFEGSVPRREYEHRPLAYRQAADFYRRYRLDDGTALDIPEQTDETLEQELLNRSEWGRTFRQGYYANCWNTYEPGNYADAMWRLYLSTNEGVAIQTNVAKLKQAFEYTSENIIMSKVRYLNYDTDVFYNSQDFPHLNANLFAPLIHKRSQFRHENELRLLFELPGSGTDDYSNIIESTPGKLIRVNPLQLIDKIILSPTSDKKFETKLRVATQNIGYNLEFEKAELSERIYF